MFESNQWDIISRLEWAADHDAAAQAISSRGRKFALKYTTWHARLLYWKYALMAYKSVFADMNEIMQRAADHGWDAVIAD